MELYFSLHFRSGVIPVLFPRSGLLFFWSVPRTQTLATVKAGTGSTQIMDFQLFSTFSIQLLSMVTALYHYCDFEYFWLWPESLLLRWPKEKWTLGMKNVPVCPREISYEDSKCKDPWNKNKFQIFIISGRKDNL